MLKEENNNKNLGALFLKKKNFFKNLIEIAQKDGDCSLNNLNSKDIAESPKIKPFNMSDNNKDKIIETREKSYKKSFSRDNDDLEDEESDESSKNDKKITLEKKEFHNSSENRNISGKTFSNGNKMSFEDILNEKNVSLNSTISFFLLIQNFIERNKVSKHLKTIYFILLFIFFTFIILIIAYWILIKNYLYNFKNVIGQVSISGSLIIPFSQSYSYINYEILYNIGLVISKNNKTESESDKLFKTCRNNFLNFINQPIDFNYEHKIVNLRNKINLKENNTIINQDFFFFEFISSTLNEMYSLFYNKNKKINDFNDKSIIFCFSNYEILRKSLIALQNNIFMEINKSQDTIYMY